MDHLTITPLSLRADTLKLLLKRTDLIKALVGYDVFGAYDSVSIADICCLFP